MSEEDADVEIIETEDEKKTKSSINETKILEFLNIPKNSKNLISHAVIEHNAGRNI